MLGAAERQDNSRSGLQPPLAPLCQGQGGGRAWCLHELE